ncbi:MAG: glycoside hydrolase family 3 C-terminal domain-containing protein, partial [Flavisolibacter sp.]
AKLVVGNGFNMPGAGGPTVGQTQDKVPGAAGTTFAIPRLGIPSIVVADGPAGVRISPIRNNDSSKTYYATAFPIGTLLASSWDTALVRKVGAAMGNEVREYGIDILLGPALNIHRNPLGGRNFEYYSEDPLIAGLMTASMVNGIESNGVGTSIKHFVANNQETNRNTINTIVSQRALREIYLKGFKIAVKNSQPWTVMSSYNLVNGTYTSQEYQLLTTILREEWGFKGFVMSDWFGGNDPVAQMKAGNDLLMPGTPEQTRRIISAVEHDSLDIKYLNQNVEHILNIIVQTPAFKHYKYSDKPDLRAHANVSRMAAAEGMVLLKNEGKTLPFTGPKPVALFGNASYDIVAGGTGSGDVNKAYVISLDKGLANAGFGLNLSLNDSYSNYIKKSKAARPKPRNFFETPPAIPEMDITDEVILQNVGNRDAAIITIGRNAGEFNDRKLENDFYLSSAEKQLIEKVSKAFHHAGKKVIVVLNIGGVIEMASWRDEVDAILLAWQPGLEGGNAIADVLTGKINPSGKLPTSFPMDYKDVPSANNFPGREFSEKATTGNFGMKMVPAEVTYEEGIYIGYRYYNTFKVPTAYEFGYGLSYTNFSYSNFKLSSTSMKGKIIATVTITNTGSVAGKEVVQVYRTAPAKYVDKPSIELIAFAKTGLLQPGKSQNLSFTITERDLASFDPQASGFITEAGQYKLSIGSSSNNIKQTATFNVPKLIIVEKDYDVLKPFEEIKELKSKQF